MGTVLAGLWPWLAVVAAGALHGLNPLTGWALAAWPASHGKAAQRPRLLVPIAAGHLGAVIVVAAAVPVGLSFGIAFEPWMAQAIAAGLLLLIALQHFGGGGHGNSDAVQGRTALTLWSFILGIGHGAGWMLMPALASLCASDVPGREITASGSFLLGIAAVCMHLAAMLGTTAAMAAGVRAFRARAASGACAHP
ncbi:hypothetical protein [Ramlibacter montanisoli]|uniref:Uncharacterized protein n=1 Tax=Ramlibacter montanisoli TaxID=2732512 RepID=A0A849KCL4_9BURK|nr:hypothetical protein [Ramlibacter montanisoli]NNU45130.1 hypothetical protein [Ramlibacter montanisoli]